MEMMHAIAMASHVNFKGVSKAKTLEMLKYLGVDIEPHKSKHYTALRRMVRPAMIQYTQPLTDKLQKKYNPKKVFSVA